MSDTAAATGEARLLRAAAEARAGDAHFALAVLRTMPSSDEQHRIASVALARLGQFADAAHELDPMSNLADLRRRAALLFEAKSWHEAGSAYAGLLSDTGLPANVRNEAADRYALALALSDGTSGQGLPNLPDPATHLLAVLPSAPDTTAGASTPGTEVQNALDRAKGIETLLGPTPTGQQGS